MYARIYWLVYSILDDSNSGFVAGCGDVKRCRGCRSQPLPARNNPRRVGAERLVDNGRAAGVRSSTGRPRQLHHGRHHQQQQQQPRRRRQWWCHIIRAWWRDLADAHRRPAALSQAAQRRHTGTHVSSLTDCTRWTRPHRQPAAAFRPPTLDLARPTSQPVPRAFSRPHQLYVTATLLALITTALPADAQRIYTLPHIYPPTDICPIPFTVRVRSGGRCPESKCLTFG